MNSESWLADNTDRQEQKTALGFARRQFEV